VRSKNFIAVEKQYLFVSAALVFWHAMRMHSTILSSVACLALQYFFTLSHKRQNFLGEGGIEHNVFVLIFPTTCLKLFLFSEELTEMSYIYLGLHVMNQLYFSDFNETNSLYRFSKNNEMLYFMKIRQLGPDG